MPNTLQPRFVLPYGHHPMFKLGHDDLDSFEVASGTFNEVPWHILAIEDLGFVVNYYFEPYGGDYQSVDGYFDTLEDAKQYLRDLFVGGSIAERSWPASLRTPPEETQANG